MTEKLIKDKVPELAAEEGDTLIVRELDNSEFKEYANRKLIEEAHEVAKAETRKETLGELADVLELVRTIAEAEDITLDELESERERKLQRAGGFDKKLLLIKGSR